MILTDKCRHLSLVHTHTHTRTRPHTHTLPVAAPPPSLPGWNEPPECVVGLEWWWKEWCGYLGGRHSFPHTPQPHQHWLTDSTHARVAIILHYYHSLCLHLLLLLLLLVLHVSANFTLVLPPSGLRLSFYFLPSINYYCYCSSKLPPTHFSPLLHSSPFPLPHCHWLGSLLGISGTKIFFCLLLFIACTCFHQWNSLCTIQFIFTFTSLAGKQWCGGKN